MKKRLVITGLLLLGSCTLWAGTGYTVGVDADDSGRWGVNVNINKDSAGSTVESRDHAPVREHAREHRGGDWRESKESRKFREEQRRESRKHREEMAREERMADEEYYRERRKKREEAEREERKRHEERMR